MIPWWPCAQVHNVDTGLPVSFAAGLTMLCENASGVSFSPPAPGDPLRCSGTTCGTCGQPWWMGSCGQYGRRESAWGAELCLHLSDVGKASAAGYFVVFHLSNQRTPSILLWHRMWNACRWAVSALVVVHVSDARSSIGTIRKYTSLFSFVKKGRSDARCAPSYPCCSLWFLSDAIIVQTGSRLRNWSSCRDISSGPL